MRNADMPAMPTDRDTANELIGNDISRKKGEKGFLGMPIGELVGTGLTKREHISAMALQGMLSRYDFLGQESDAADMAVRFADALLAELEKTS